MLTILPFDSTPSATGLSPAVTATAHPVLLPLTFVPGVYGDTTCPPSGDHPLGVFGFIQLLNVVILPFPRTIK